MAEYYVKTKEGARKQGPFTRDQLKALAAGGKIKPHYLVSKDQRQWFVAKNITDLPLGQATRAARSAVPGRPARARASASVAEPAPFAEGASEARMAARHAADEIAQAARRKRMSSLLLYGLGGVMVVVVGVVAYFLYIHSGQTDEGDDLDDIPAAVSVGGTSPAPTPGGSPTSGTDRAGGAGAAGAPPDRGRIDEPTGVPKPDRKFEPPRPPGSFRVLSVVYGGQQVRAMGSRLLFELTNESGKTIQSVAGAVRLYDSTGAFLAALDMKLGETIEPGATIRKGGVWIDIGGTILGMLDSSSKEMKFRFAVDEVTYGDGTIEKFK